MKHTNHTSTNWKSYRFDAKSMRATSHKKRVGYSLAGHIASKPRRVSVNSDIAKLYS